MIRQVKDIDKSIKSLYGQFMVENDLNPKKALEIIKGKEFRNWRMTMEEYLSQIKATEDKALLLELNTLAMRSRINRLEALQAEIMAQSAIIASKEEEVIGSFLSDSIEDAYYKNVYDEYKDRNPEALDLMDRHKVAIPRNQVKKALELPWSGANYSDNIWNSSYFIAKRAQAMVAKNIIAGRSIENLSRDFAKIHGRQYYSNVKRLIRTETAYVKGQADLLTYEKLGVEEYELLATLDNRTSSICQEKDGQHFPVDEVQVGINYPPFHPNCRTTTIKYREDYGDRTRMAKDKDGRNVKVPLDLKYKEWRKWVDSKYKENTKKALTEKEERAINQYKSSESYKINEKLYNNDKLNNKEMEFVGNLDNALNKMPNYEGDLVRDLYFADKKALNKFVESHEAGNTVNYKAYTSTTKANSYNDMANARIYINNSKMGKDISSIGLDEEEVLYPRNTEFIVKDKGKNNVYDWIVLEEI